MLVEAGPDADGPWQALVVHADSPYGAQMAATSQLAEGRIQLRNRSHKHRDLQQDYAHLLIPAEAISPQGTLFIQVQRMDADIAQIWHRIMAPYLFRPMAPF